MNLAAIQRALREQEFDAWLFCDHHHRDAIAYSILGLPSLHATRRWFYLIPAASADHPGSAPIKLTHRVEPGHLSTLPGTQQHYTGWRELHEKLAAMVRPYHRIAMQYSPNADIPAISLVDAGTVELIRGFGVEVVSSADLVSQFEATLTPVQIATHFEARDHMDAIMAAVFQEIGHRVRHGGWYEWAVRQWLEEALQREHLVSDSAPIVAASQNSANPHYQPSASLSRDFQAGDLILIDMWAKLNRPDAIYYDITWTGVIGQPSERQQQIFRIVRDARKAATQFVIDATSASRRIAGCEVDQAARAVIERAGFGENFVHRTGHSIGTSVHGNGANIDNLETRDSRQILPNTIFSIEPGIYLREFGIRSEVNMLVRNGRAQLTGREQEELVIF
jgi:Xaa-Pro aminopeptidase